MALDLFAPPVTKKPSRRPAVTPAVLPQEQPQEPAKPDDPSILRRVGNVTGGGLSAVGNLLDVPGSVVRSVLRLHNPLDTILHPLSDVNRTSGRDLIRSYGLAGKEDTWGNFGAGLAADIALDPLTYLTGGAAAYGKTGKLLKGAGVVDDAARVAAAKAGKAVSTIGKNEARLTTTAGDFLTHGAPEVAAKVEKLNLTPEQLNEPLGSLFRFGGHAVGTGPTAIKVAQGIDTAKRAVKFAKVPGTDFAPINELHRLFHAPIGEMKTPLMQEQASHLFRQKQEAAAKIATETAGHANELDAIAKKYAGNAAYDEITPSNIRRFVEMKTGGPNFPPELHDLRDKFQQRLSEMPVKSAAEGRGLGEYIDDALHYFPRFITEGLQKGPGQAGGKAISTFDPSQLARKEFLHGIPEGADVVRELAQHPEFNKLIDNGGTPQQISAFIHSNFGDRIPAMYQSSEMKPVLDEAGKVLGSEPVMKARAPELADWISGLKPETRQSGVFGNHPLLDLHHRRLNDEMASLATNKVFETLKQPGVLQPASKAARNEGSTTVGELFQKMGLDGTNLPFDPKSRVANDVGDDLLRMLDPIKTPNPTHPIMDAADSLTNLFKSSVTSAFPSFHSRNLTSGQIQNAMVGMFSPQSVKDAHTLLKGQIVKDASKIPAVQALATEKGIPHLDDATATQLLGELAHAHNVAPKFEGELGSVVGKTNNVTGASIDDLLGGIPGPGRVGFDAKKLADLALGRKSAGTTWNPLKATYRGVNGALESTFAPSAAGQYLGSAIEGMNRVAPFVHQLRQGIDPAEAARRIGSAQAEYSGKHFTKFEQQAMKRLFPFYSFSKSMAKFVPQHVAQNPGGPMAQSFRMANRAHNPDESTPDYVRDTLSAPLNGVPIVGHPPEGTSRYLSGLGLMPEDIAALVGSGPSGTLLEAASRLNPILKGPLELATNQSFFQKSAAGGGRSLDDLDPTIGRIISNVTGRKEATTFPGSKALEFIAGNSPAARALTTVRQLTDPRKNAAVKGLNTLTGLRISDVSPQSKDALTRERAQVLMKEMGAKNFLRTYFPKKDLASMTPTERKAAMEYQALLNSLAQTAKSRKAEK